MLTRAALALLVLLATPLCADALKVGQEAPKFKAGGNIINPPEFARELKDSVGDVILIYEWHNRDATRSGLADIQKYHDKWNGRGLQVWTIHRLDFEKFPEIDIIARQEGWSFPICMGGFYDESNDFFGYKDGKSFRTTVVGVDGKVAYYGKDAGWKAALDAELAKAIYPNLGKHAVAEGARDPAKDFAERKFGKALLGCEKLLAGELADDVKADVQLVQQRAKELADKRLERIKAWKEDKRYDLVVKALEVLAAEYKGHTIGSDADVEIKALKKDKEIKKELGAFESLDKLIAKDGKTDPQGFVNALREFAKQQNRFRAGTVATEMADRIKAYME